MQQKKPLVRMVSEFYDVCYLEILYVFGRARTRFSCELPVDRDVILSVQNAKEHGLWGVAEKQEESAL